LSPPFFMGYQMDQSKKKISNPHEGQFLYKGKWVNKEHFRAFLYNEKHVQRLAKSYKEFESLLATGLWFAEKPEQKVLPLKRKIKDGSANSKEICN